MGLFSKLFSGGTPAWRPTIEGVPQLAPVIAPMQRGDIRPALALYQASPDAELRHCLVVLAATMFGPDQTRTQLLDAWVANTPNEPYARLVRARWRTDSLPKWSMNSPEDVAARAREAHAAAGQRSADDYHQVVRASPADIVPLGLRLSLSMVDDLAAKRRLYAEIEARQPLYFPAQLTMHHWLSAMWWGDHAQSVGFMRGVAARAPEGSDLHALLVYGHFRVYEYELHHGAGAEAATRYAADPAVRAECLQALERSLWSPQHRPGYWGLFARHCAACWFRQIDDLARCKAELAQCGNFYDVNAAPWNLSADGYARMRKDVGL